MGEKYRAELYQTLARGEQAGLPRERTLLLCGQINTAVARRTAPLIRAQSQGQSLADAGLATGLWCDLDFQVITVGEQSGLLADLFKRLADHYSLRNSNRRRRRMQLMLPAFLLVFSVLVTPLPKLISGELTLFGYMNASLTPLVLMTLSGYLLYHLPGILRHLPLMVDCLDRLQVDLPLIGPWYLRRQLGEFINTLALLLGSGIPARQATQLANLSKNTIVRSRINRMEAALDAGASLTEALAAIDGLNPRALAMARSGESAGALEQMLLRYGKLESETLQNQNKALAIWIPRLVYFALVAWIGWQLIGSRIGSL